MQRNCSFNYYLNKLLCPTNNPLDLFVIQNSVMSISNSDVGREKGNPNFAKLTQEQISNHLSVV